MKNGRKILNRVIAAPCLVTAMRGLGNDKLRSLILHLGTPELRGTEAGDALLMAAMCEATARFMQTKCTLMKLCK